MLAGTQGKWKKIKDTKDAALAASLISMPVPLQINSTPNHKHTKIGLGFGQPTDWREPCRRSAPPCARIKNSKKKKKKQ
jgi:hypothetical protein